MVLKPSNCPCVVLPEWYFPTENWRTQKPRNLNPGFSFSTGLGLDRNETKQAFTTYLEGGNFSANQIHFVENIIDYLTQNGVMDPGWLIEPTFTDLHPEGLDGVFRDDDADQIISLVRSFNETVEAEFGAA
ncbi:MAG: hypothetical protein M3N42_14245 [Cyanobacteriota bacterium]|nr:hypothetical protein [Cyanobacteriota bacterium]